jgi:co-chaperonin GroES (HSP10)
LQAQNIVILDKIVRHFEEEALNEFYEHDKFSIETLSPLSAMSQVWVFALYEFLRTWRQRASRLIVYHERFIALKTDDERAAYTKKLEEEALEKAKHVKLAPVFYFDHTARVSEGGFVEAIREYRESIKGLFHDVEAIRIPLAKHEIAGNKNLIAEAPGYGRVDLLTGSMYWQIALSNGTVDVINRHSLADRFFGTDAPKAESALFAGDGEKSYTPTSDLTRPAMPSRSGGVTNTAVSLRFRPCGDRVVIQRREAEQKSPMGVIIPDVAQEASQLGIILAIGPGSRRKRGRYTAPDLMAGDTVIFEKRAGYEFSFGGLDLLIMDISEIVAVVLSD